MEWSADIDYQGKTKRTQYWLSICLTWEDVCGIQYLALLERSLWLSWWSRCLLSGSLLYKDIPGGKKQFVPPLPHTALIRQHYANQNGHWTDNQSEYPMESNPPTAKTLRLCKLNQTRHCPRGSKSFQHSWTHLTDLFPNSSKSPQTFQTSNIWANAFKNAFKNQCPLTALKTKATGYWAMTEQIERTKIWALIQLWHKIMITHNNVNVLC